jgi:prepilin-type N-terminal cleavage/methylation domain-containing protein
MFRRLPAAFTLLEITAVLAVAGLLLALSLPRFVALRDVSAVHGAMDELAATFSLARRLALTRRELVAIAFDTAGSAVEVRSVSGSFGRHSLGSAYGIALGANRDSTVYDPRGLGYGLSNLTVIIRRGGIVDTLTMSRLGRVKY